jgi:hypothetical protein
MSDTLGKIRGRYTNDVVGLAQWIGRKLRNHDPLSERDGGAERNAKGKVRHRSMKDGTAKPGVLGVALYNTPLVPMVFHSTEDGRVFRIMVEEVEALAVPTLKLEDIGA